MPYKGIDGPNVNELQGPAADFEENWWNQTVFKVSLWLALLFKGKTKMYAVLRAQANLETAHLTSKGFNQRKSPFGMRPSVLRKKYWSGESNGFAVYSTYWAAIQDRLDLDSFNKVTYQDDEQYITAVVAKGYVPAESRAGYIRLWRTLTTDYRAGNEPSNSWLWWLLAALLGVGVLWYVWRRR